MQPVQLSASTRNFTFDLSAFSNIFHHFDAFLALAAHWRAIWHSAYLIQSSDSRIHSQDKQKVKI